ncbi:3'-5' exoribonuclease [Marinitoga hydrogenitolerans DSM 16785]|uniref:3'-5' exoribonuclease n=1 Tax=Marinitoga hydrogenitolerans (strain DSM 16785 / JCM 12826 / AT1271) TaxID=1122195 RepID=A0A1M4S9F7_MARH1|nr:HD domain-containing protein [Marinitoga hydrogenitolerans]SHE28687.1 3'-5' exoribonuclease [Marinitoga hydrogenitolerans DSM 16785]
MNNNGMNLGDLLKEKGQLTNDLLSETYISELKPNDSKEIEGKVVSKRLQTTRDGKEFLLFTISDKTGTLRAIDWFNARENSKNINIGDVIRLKGKIVVFENRLQLNVEKNYEIYKLKENEINQEKFIKTSSKNIHQLKDELQSFIEVIKNPYIKELLTYIFIKDKKFYTEFSHAPAAINVHHAYKHGLLEHTIDVAKLCDSIAKNYINIVNKDILIAGALLHDIGKTKEYKITPSGIEKTDAGELIGHIAIGIHMVSEYAKKIHNFPKELLDEILHMVASHHGELEWGSPIVPKTIEAFILHFADNLSSKVEQVKNHIEESNNLKWTDYHKNLGRKFKITKMEDK